MASLSDEDELDYLSPDFDPSSLTVPRIRAILVQHDIPYTSSAKKPQLIEIFNEKLRPQSRKILAARARIRRTSKGITDMPSSQEGTINGDVEEDLGSMAPPPTRTPGRKPRKSARPPAEDDIDETPGPRKIAGKRRSSKHPRASDSEAGLDAEGVQPVTQRSRKSEITPTVKVEDPDLPVRPSLGESVFSDDNPFQSGSSPIGGDDARRRSSGIKKEKRTSRSRRRRTDEAEPIKQEDGVVVPSSSTFEMPVSRFPRLSRVKPEPEDALAPSEEFTPEEQQAMIQEGTARGEVDMLRRRRRKQSTDSAIPRSAPWVILMTLLVGYGAWYRKEKIEVGYCGIGRPVTSVEHYQVPDWAIMLQPQCEPCPPHARCYGDMLVECDTDFVLKPHPLALGGLVPLTPTCEPDGEKVRKVKAVADRAIEELRERRVKWECGELVEEDGKAASAVEIDEPVLKAEVSQKRRRGMTDAEFEDLWKGALGEIIARDEVTSDNLGNPLAGAHRLSSSSLARLPLGCALRRSVRITLARYRVEAAGLLTLILALSYVRSRIQTQRSDSARVPALISTTLDRLSTQAALHEQGSRPEPWISVGQMRDDVLRDEFSAARREAIWKRVKVVVEMNANVRASVKEGRLGEVSRVWEWIGSLPALEDQWSSDRRRSSGGVGGVGGRQSLVSYEGGMSGSSPERRSSPAATAETRKWDEGRPIY